MIKDLGTYPGGVFVHAPYAAQFRLLGTRFRLNLVLCHIEPNAVRNSKADETAHLEDVFRYFENLTGNRGITLLLAGGLRDMRDASGSLIPQGEMLTLSRDQGQQVFASTALRPLIEESGLGASTPPVAYVTLGTGNAVPRSHP